MAAKRLRSARPESLVAPITYHVSVSFSLLILIRGMPGLDRGLYLSSVSILFQNSVLLLPYCQWFRKMSFSCSPTCITCLKFFPHAQLECERVKHPCQKDMIREVRASIICLQETKLQSVTVEMVSEMLGPNFRCNFSFLPTTGTCGGILIAVSEVHIRLLYSSCSKNTLTVRI
jgi:hypothetical protein